MNNIDILKDVTFKTKCYQKNFNFFGIDNFISLNEGEITKLRNKEDKHKPPIVIGEYSFSTWNLKVAKLYDVNIDQVILFHKNDDTYDELFHLRKQGMIDFNNINRLHIIHSFILCKEYRKKEITQEFFEMLYRTLYCENDMILVLVKPFQYNIADYDYFYNHKTVTNLKSIKPRKYVNDIASEYYSLNEFLDDDYEYSSFKLFSLAQKCGLSRIAESHIFKFIPEKTIERIKEKTKIASEYE